MEQNCTISNFLGAQVTEAKSGCNSCYSFSNHLCEVLCTQKALDKICVIAIIFN